MSPLRIPALSPTAGRVLGWALAVVLATLVGPVVLELMVGGEQDPGIHSATGAWLMGQVHRQLQLGDYGLAARLGGLDTSSYSVLYPLTVGALAKVFGDPVAIARWLSGACWGLSAVPLFVIGRRLSAHAAGGVLAGSSLLAPVVAVSAVLIRSTSMALLLALLAILVTAAALEGQDRTRPALAGLLCGLVFTARSYLGSIALPLGLLVALVPTTMGWRRRSERAFLFTGSSLVGVLVPCVLAGVNPLFGLNHALAKALMAPASPTISELLGGVLPACDLHPGLLVGGALSAGLLIARPPGSRARPLAIALLGVTLLLPIFLALEQQKAQYYLLFLLVCSLCLTSALAWLATRVPSRPGAVLPWLFVAGALGWAGPRCVGFLGSVFDPSRPQELPLRTDAWEADPRELARVATWIDEAARDRPLVVYYDAISVAFFDQALLAWRDRPSLCCVASAGPDGLLPSPRREGTLASLPLALAWVGPRGEQPPSITGAELEDRLLASTIQARIWGLDALHGVPAQPSRRVFVPGQCESERGALLLHLVHQGGWPAARQATVRPPRVPSPLGPGDPPGGPSI